MHISMCTQKYGFNTIKPDCLFVIGTVLEHRTGVYHSYNFSFKNSTKINYIDN